MAPYIRIGVISASHGIKGEAKIYPTTDDIRRFDCLEYCFLEEKGEMIRLDVCVIKTYAIFINRGFNSFYLRFFNR